jgi:hypothetical protein
MSRLPERPEKRCLNCEALIYGRFCQVCGQENSNHHVGFFQLARHFIFDIFHFDGKFFSTIGKLFTHPGLVSKEFIAGKRATHLDPIKMYVFTSAIFFLLFFKLFQPNGKTITTTNTTASPVNDTAIQTNNNRDTTIQRSVVNGFDITPYTSIGVFDSTQKKLPPEKRLSGVKRFIIRKAIYLKTEKGISDKALLYAFLSDFLHRLPQAMFVTLPLFALLLKLLYIRHKRWYYFEYGIFSIHFFIVGFICILAAVLLERLAGWTGMPFFSSINALPLLGLIGYLYFAMKRFYGQPVGKTILKWLLLMLSGIFTLVVVIALFAFISLIYL